MNNLKPTNLLIRLIFVLVLLAITLSACGTPPAAPTATLTPEPAPIPTAVPTSAPLLYDGLVYGDPDGRFSLPLVGDWTPVETDGSYGHFTLADPVLEMYIVTVESDDLDIVAEMALAQIGLDPAALSQLAKAPSSHWTFFIYELFSGQGVGLAVRQLGDISIAVILRGETDLMISPPADVFLTLDGFAYLPLADYLAFQTPPAPGTVQDIENLNHVEFYNGKTKLVGKLVLPEGDGPFPAVVCVHGSGLATRTDCDNTVSDLRAAGLAVFSYDKRGVGESEGIFVGVTDINNNPSPSEWRLPQLADDALAAVAFLQNLHEINPDQIGLLGASQAGSIIPQVAAQSNIPAFAVIVIGQTVSVGEVYYYQQFTGQERRLPTMTESERDELSAQLATFNGDPGFDPRPYIETMEIPALWIWGDLDGWIPPRRSQLEMDRIITEHDKDFTILYDMEFGHEFPKSWNSVLVDWILAQLEE